jgi:hypothetical protein
VYLQLDSKAWKCALERSCESNRRVRDEDIDLVEPVDRVTRVFEDEWIIN